MRCRKHDEGDKGCIKEAGHLARCKVRPNPDDPRPDVGDRRAHRRGRNGPAPPLRPAAPSDATGAGSPGVRDGRGLVARHIEALTVQDVIANKAARKALVGLARAILEMFDKPEPRGT